LITAIPTVKRTMARMAYQPMGPPEVLPPGKSPAARAASSPTPAGERDYAIDRLAERDSDVRARSRIEDRGTAALRAVLDLTRTSEKTVIQAIDGGL
jgi:hypothetical protein